MPSNKNIIKKIKEEGIYNRKVLNGSGLQIVRFCAEWSGPCQIMAPIYDEMQMMFKTAASFYRVDIDEVPFLKEKLGITDLPTILFYRDGVTIDFIVGLISRDLFIARLETAIK